GGRRTHHRVGRGEPARPGRAEASRHELPDGRGDRCGHRDHHEDAGECPGTWLEHAEAKRCHGYALSSVRRSLTTSARGFAISSTIRPSARNRTRSATAAATGSWVTITSVRPSRSVT